MNQLFSVRTLTLVLSLLLVVTTAAICLSLSLTTASEALNDTEASGDEALATAFESAETNIKILTERYLTELSNNVIRFTANLFDGQVRAFETMMNILQPLANTATVPNVEVDMMDFWATFDRLRPLASLIPEFETAGAFLLTRLDRVYGIVENPYTIQHDVGFRSYMAVIGRATNSKVSEMFEIDKNMDSVSPYWKCDRSNNCENNPTAQISSGVPCPASPFGACPVHAIPTVSGGSISRLAIPLPRNFRYWGSFATGGSYVGVGLTAPIYSDVIPKHPLYDQRVGLFYWAVDLIKVTQFMERMDLPEGSRVFGVVSHGVDMGYLTGASHGGAKLEGSYDPSTAMTTYLPVNCTMSNDTITRNVCVWALNEPGQFMGLNPNATYTLRPNVDKAPDEDYFVRASVLSDAYGLRWTMFAVIPRSVVLGKVDATQLQTVRTIEANKQRISDKKADKQLIMAIVLSVVCLALMLGAAVFTMAITRPMIELQREMVSVAHMDLEAIDMSRPVSALSEVGSMQTSFLRMCRNLLEYRNYLPASILEMMCREGADTGSDDTGEEDELLEKSTTTASYSSHSAHSHSTPISQLAQRSSVYSGGNARPSDSDSRMLLKKRRISVVVVNIRRFHVLVDLDPSDAAATHSRLI
eukprot:PhM_4_TR13901/c2_g1_i3/m.96093